MVNFLVKTTANAVALAVAVLLLPDITLTGTSTAGKTGTLILVALIFGVVNFLVKPIATMLALPVLVLSLGLFTLVINALMLLLTSWIADTADLSFHVEGFWTAVLGGLIVSIISWAMNMLLPDSRD